MFSGLLTCFASSRFFFSFDNLDIDSSWAASSSWSCSAFFSFAAISDSAWKRITQKLINGRHFGWGGAREGRGRSLLHPRFRSLPESSFTPLILRNGRTNNWRPNVLEINRRLNKCVLRLTHYMIACENSHLFSLLAAGETSPAVSGEEREGCFCRLTTWALSNWLQHHSQSKTD